MGGYPGSNLGWFGEVGVPGAPLDPIIYVLRSGSAMYGPLLMSNDVPAQPREPVTLVYMTTELAQADVTLRAYTDGEILIVRNYVDAQNVIVLQDAKDYTDAAIAALPPIPPVTGFLPITGGVITGDLQVTGDTNVVNLNASANINTNGMYFEQGRPLNTIYLQLTGGWISGNLGVFGDLNVASGQYLLNGQPFAADQTPWTQTIDAADFPLTSPNSLIFAVGGSNQMRITPGGGVECATLIQAPEVRCLGPFVTVRVDSFGGASSVDLANALSFNTSGVQRMTIDDVGIVRIGSDMSVTPPPVGPTASFAHVMIGGSAANPPGLLGSLGLYGWSNGATGSAWCGILSFVNSASTAPQSQVAIISALHLGDVVNNRGALIFMTNSMNTVSEQMRIDPVSGVVVQGNMNLQGGQYLINGQPVADFAAAIQALETRVGRLESA